MASIFGNDLGLSHRASNLLAIERPYGLGLKSRREFQALTREELDRGLRMTTRVGPVYRAEIRAAHAILRGQMAAWDPAVARYLEASPW